MTVYEQAVSAAENGKYVKINFADNTLTIGKKIINCQAENNLIARYEGNQLFGYLEQLYEAYKVSMPAKRNRHSYFYAKPAEELTDEELATGEPRDVARVKLEAAILCYKLNGQLVWPDDKKWFIKGNDGDFVLLKEWFA